MFHKAWFADWNHGHNGLWVPLCINNARLQDQLWQLLRFWWFLISCLFVVTDHWKCFWYLLLIVSCLNIQNINFGFVLILRLSLCLGYRTALLYVNDRFLSSTPSDVYSTNAVLIRIHCGITYEVLNFLIIIKINKNPVMKVCEFMK